MLTRKPAWNQRVAAFLDSNDRPGKLDQAGQRLTMVLTLPVSSPWAAPAWAENYAINGQGMSVNQITPELAANEMELMATVKLTDIDVTLLP